MKLSEIKDSFKFLISQYSALKTCDLVDKVLDLEDEFDKKDFLAAGLSTAVFKKDNETVKCLSIDIAKVSYLKKTFKNKGFKFIKFVEYEDDGAIYYAMIYEMPLLKKITYGEPEDDFIIDYCDENEFEDQPVGIFCEECQNYVEGIGVELDYDVLTNIMSRYNAQADLHREQFMKDKEGKVICIDPIISSYIYV